MPGPWIFYDDDDDDDDDDDEYDDDVEDDDDDGDDGDNEDGEDDIGVFLPGSGDDVRGGENIGGGAGPIGASRSYTLI